MKTGRGRFSIRSWNAKIRDAKGCITEKTLGLRQTIAKRRAKKKHAKRLKEIIANNPNARIYHMEP